MDFISSFFTEFDLPPEVTKLVIAVALGMFLGLEREWSQKTAGIRTFSLISLSGALFTLLENEMLVGIGALLVLMQGGFLAIQGLEDENRGLSLTTSTSMLVAYGVGILVAKEFVLEGVTVAVLSSLLLVLKRELHGFAQNLSKEEVKSAAEFGILAFVIYPLLPDKAMGPWNSINPRTVWLLVVAVSAIGFVNYVIIKEYGGRGVLITSFFGGLVNSTAVIGEISSRAKKNPGMKGVAVGSILLADAAMALRNTLIVVVFIPGLIIGVGFPLGVIAIAGGIAAFFMGDWSFDFEADLRSPFSLGNALKFGALFLVVLLVSAGAKQFFGAPGFVFTSFLGGLVSSGSTTTTAVLLASSGQIAPSTAAIGVVAGTASSILVKTAFAATIDRSLVRPVAAGSFGLITAGTITALMTTLM